MNLSNMNLGAGTITLTDEKGKKFELGEVSQIECDSKLHHIKNSNTSLEFTIKLNWKSKIRFKWEMWKAKRKAKKVIKTFYGEGQPHEFTLTFNKKDVN